MQFSKMHALGNDFVIFGSPARKTLPKSETIRFLCDRHYGVGADCAVFISYSSRGDYFMHVYNPDGFEAEMCGNALRCSAKYVTDRGYFKKRTLTAETCSGLRALKVDNNNVTAEIGKPLILKEGTLSVSGVQLPYTSVSLGNPHCVIFASSLSNDEFTYFGSSVENHPLFPEGTNVEFASVTDSSNILMRVWERGIGETLSCATGSCACAAAAEFNGMCGSTVFVHQTGGTIEVNTRECGNMFICGECVSVFKGNII